MNKARARSNCCRRSPVPGAVLTRSPRHWYVSVIPARANDGGFTPGPATHNLAIGGVCAHSRRPLRAVPRRPVRVISGSPTSWCTTRITRSSRTPFTLCRWGCSEEPRPRRRPQQCVTSCSIPLTAVPQQITTSAPPLLVGQLGTSSRNVPLHIAAAAAQSFCTSSPLRVWRLVAVVRVPSSPAA